jgi:pyrroloquinoline-quinone synthase
MNYKSILDARIEKWALLKHPFYQAWEVGELPMPALQSYAREYGAFISLMPKGWETLGDKHTVDEEIEHIALWQDFAIGVGTQLDKAELAEVVDLVETTQDVFSEPIEALGALYAFEVQQPETAKSKLKGLKEHYDLPETVEPYFVEHSNNEHEAEKLIEKIAKLSEEQFESALNASERMSKSMWDALTGIYNKYCLN